MSTEADDGAESGTWILEVISGEVQKCPTSLQTHPLGKTSTLRDGDHDLVREADELDFS